MILSLATGGLLVAPPETASASYTAAVRDYVNLRAEPTPDSEIVTVVNPGTHVQVVGEPQNGYVEVVADGVSGYISGEFLADVAEDPLRDYFGTGYEDNTRWVIGIAALNLRAEPNASSEVLQVMPEGTELTLTREAVGPYAGVVAADGTVGWVSPNSLTPNLPDSVAPVVAPGVPPDSSVPHIPAEPPVEGEPPVDDEPPAEPEPPTEPEPPADPEPPTEPEPPVDPEDPGNSETVPVGEDVTGTATVIGGGLNLRSGPGGDYVVVSIMPLDATVELRGEQQNGYHPVSYNGQTGWANVDFLAVAADPVDPPADPDPGDPPADPDPGEPSDPDPTDPPADPEPTPEPVEPPSGGGDLGSLVTTAAVNHRAAPSLDAEIVNVLPPFTAVDILGDPQNGFYPVSFGGNDGWAHGDYLVPPDAAPGPSDPPDGGGDIIDIIHAAADAYGQPREDMVRVASCESNFDPSAVNASSGASGLFQFMPGTWQTTPFADQDIFDPVANANAAGWMWENGRRNEWVCQ